MIDHKLKLKLDFTVYNVPEQIDSRLVQATEIIAYENHDGAQTADLLFGNFEIFKEV